MPLLWPLLLWQRRRKKGRGRRREKGRRKKRRIKAAIVQTGGESRTGGTRINPRLRPAAYVQRRGAGHDGESEKDTLCYVRTDGDPMLMRNIARTCGWG